MFDPAFFFSLTSAPFTSGLAYRGKPTVTERSRRSLSEADGH